MTVSDEWYSPDQVADSYHPRLVTWVLRNLGEIRTHGWPMEPRERVKLKPPRRTYYEARWENESSVVGRITGILEKQGLGGAIAYLVYTAGISPAEAARMLGIYEDQAVELMARALNQVRIKKHGTRKTLQHG